ncbi:phosphatase PAP2 family protein [bacterium]|nr:phosphatase PAP2 family protein [bacterium]
MKREKILLGIVLVVLGVIIHLLPEINKFLFYQINNFHFHWLDTIMLPITYCGDGTVLAIVALGLWRLRGWRKFLWLVLILASAGILVQMIKYFFPSPRPSAVFPDIHILGSVLRAHSFPSGHTASTFGLISFLSGEFPQLGNFLWVMAILIGFSRVYVGAHFPADVLFGAGLGYLVAKIYMMIWERRGKVEKE